MTRAEASPSTTRTRLLDAAGPVFAEKGLDGATVREICRRAGSNIAGIHYHFGDKKALYREVIRYARRQREAAYPFPDEAGMEPRRWLATFIKVMLQRLLEPDAPWQVRLLMREVLNPTEACRTLVQEYFRPDFERLLRVVRRLAGPGVSEEACRSFALSIVGQCLFYHFSRRVLPVLFPDAADPTRSIERLAADVADFSLAALDQIRAGRRQGGPPDEAK